MLTEEESEEIWTADERVCHNCLNWLSVRCLQETNFWLSYSCERKKKNSLSVTHSHHEIERKQKKKVSSKCPLTGSIKFFYTKYGSE